jgi:hypothetical protein
VDVSGVPGDAPALVGTIDGRDGAKAVVRGGDALYLVEEEGRWWTGLGAGAASHARPEPFLRLPAPAEGERLVDVYPSSERDDEWLVVHTRGAGALQPHESARATRDLSPRLDEPDPVRDERMRVERARRGVADPITSVEHWKRELPDSYAATAADAEADRVRDLQYRLTAPEARRRGTGRYRNEAEYREWIRAVEVPGSTILTLVRRGAVVARRTVTGEVVHLVESDVACSPVDFRARGDSLTAVLALQGAAGAGEAPDPALYLVRTAEAR